MPSQQNTHLHHARPGDLAPPSRPRVLVIEQDRGVREWITWLLTTERAAVTATAGSLGALTALRDCRPTVVVMDLRLTDPPGGYLLVRALRRADPRLPVVAYTDPTTAARARQTPGVTHVVIRGAHGLEELVAAVHAAHESYSSPPPPQE